MILGHLRNYPGIRKIPTILLLSLAFFACYDLQSILNNLKGFQILNSGLQTCFSRVNQSFVSTVFGVAKSSSHLKPEFFSITEECFGDVLKRAEPLFAEVNKEVDPKINSLVSEVYWFHKDLKEKASSENIKKRFKKMENTNVAALKELETLDAKGMSKIERKRILFYSSFAALFLMILLDLWVFKNEGLAKDEVIMEKHEDKVLKNTEIITSVLSYPFVPPRPSPTFVNNSQGFSTIINLPSTLNAKEIEKDLGERTYLDDVLIKVIDILSVPLFTKGIVLDMEINEDVFVFVPAEVLEQTLFSFLNFSINNFPENSFDRKINLKTKILGSTLILEMRNNGAPFGESFLKDSNGFQLITESNKRLLDLKIGTELIRENLGNVFFENNSGLPQIKIQLKSTKLKNSKVRTRIKKVDSLELLA